MSPRPTMAKENVQTDWTRRVITHTITNPNSKLLHFRFMDQNEQEVSLTKNTTSTQSDLLTQNHTVLQSDSLTQSPSTDLASDVLQSFRLTAPIRSALKGDSKLPDSYDLRDSGVITSIKDQGNSGACWAFGTLKSAESNAIRKGFLAKNHADFSENHLAWFAFHPSERGGD